MHALSQRPDLRVSVQGFFLNYDDPDHKLVWSFPVRGVMAYPSVVRRQVVTGPKGTEVQMAIVCEAPQPVCQTFAGEFMKLNGLMAERLNAQAGGGAGAGAGAGIRTRTRARATGESTVNGAESLVHTLLACGVDTCFANPGTSEMHFVAALDRIPGMRCILGLHETVVTGAADGYARMQDRAGLHAAALRARPRERAGKPAQRAAGSLADREHRGRPGHVITARSMRH